MRVHELIGILLSRNMRERVCFNNYEIEPENVETGLGKMIKSNGEHIITSYVSFRCPQFIHPHTRKEENSNADQDPNYN